MPRFSAAHFLEAATAGPMGPATCLVSPQWLRANAGAVTVLDASWHMPAAKRDARAEHSAGPRVPGSAFFDIDAVADKATALPHMLPPAGEFAAAVAALGVRRSRPVVVYDTAGLFSAARAWWTLKAFGHPAAAVLDGGLPGWLACGGPVETGPPAAPPAPPAPLEAWSLDAGMVADLRHMTATAAAWDAAAVGVDGSHRPTGGGGSRLDLMVDARPAGRFTGEAPEPRPGLPSGHIPHARSVPFSALLDAAEGSTRLLPADRLRQVLADAGVPVDYARGRIVTSCGSGVTASVVYLALAACGRPTGGTALYDGSWTEYAAHPDAPRATGPATPPLQ
jgi:thiosulfate/3-mercaptopyruvate sulfurtransferase